MVELVLHLALATHLHHFTTGLSAHISQGWAAWREQQVDDRERCRKLAFLEEMADRIVLNTRADHHMKMDRYRLELVDDWDWSFLPGYLQRLLSSAKKLYPKSYEHYCAVLLCAATRAALHSTTDRLFGQRKALRKSKAEGADLTHVHAAIAAPSQESPPMYPIKG